MRGRIAVRRGTNAVRIAAPAVAFGVLASAVPAAAQQFQARPIEHRGTTGRTELGGVYGYQWGGDFAVYSGYVDVGGHDNFQFMLDFPVPGRGDVKIELSYSRTKATTTLVRYPSGVSEDLFDVAFEYYQIGGVYGYERNNLVPFGLLTLGAARMAPETDRYNGESLEDEWAFAMTLGLGVKALMSDRVGLRLQGRLLLPFTTGGGGFWCSTGGCGLGVSAGSAFIQGDVGAGLFILF